VIDVKLVHSRSRPILLSALLSAEHTGQDNMRAIKSNVSFWSRSPAVLHTDSSGI